MGQWKGVVSKLQAYWINYKGQSYCPKIKIELY